jgi:hypothetical protein
VDHFSNTAVTKLTGNVKIDKVTAQGSEISCVYKDQWFETVTGKHSFFTI